MLEEVRTFIKHLEDWKLFDNTLLQYASFVLVTALLWMLLQFLRTFIKNRLESYSSRTKTTIDDHFAGILTSIRPWFLFFVSLHIGTRCLDMHPNAARVQSILFVIVGTLQAVITGSQLLVHIVNNIGRGQIDPSPALASTKYNIIAIGRIAIWIGAILFLLDNLGVNIGTFITGLGIGGIAIALAAQAILGDAFSAFTIGLDKPFEPGDFIVVDQLKGTVERVGLKTTRVRSLDGELLVFANSDLTKSRLQNFKRMAERRINFTIGVEYSTSIENLKKIPDIVQKAIESSSQKVRFERCYFRDFGDSALVFDVVYWVDSPEMAHNVTARHEINLGILETFNSKGISMAFPTRTIFQKTVT